MPQTNSGKEKDDFFFNFYCFLLKNSLFIWPYFSFIKLQASPWGTQLRINVLYFQEKLFHKTQFNIFSY